MEEMLRTPGGVLRNMCVYVRALSAVGSGRVGGGLLLFGLGFVCFPPYISQVCVGVSRGHAKLSK